MEMWFSEFHTPDVKHSIRVNRQLYSKQSDYQRIDIFETPEFGRVLTLDGNVINPRLLSSSIDIHPLLVIASLLVGGAVGGVLGMLLAVPVGTLLKIQFERLLELREAKKTGQIS